MLALFAAKVRISLLAVLAALHALLECVGASTLRRGQFRASLSDRLTAATVFRILLSTPVRPDPLS
jgi:hypothetical protein